MDDNKTIVICWCVTIISVVLFFTALTYFAFNGENGIPYCEEDELIQGAGDYEDGNWERYRCIDGD